MVKKTFNINSEDKKLFENVSFLVEATYYEQQLLWEKFHYHPDKNSVSVKDWVQDTMGRIVTIGYVDKRPVCVGIFYANLNGKKVAFYEGTSQLVDHQMIKDWLKHWTSKIRWDNNTRWAHCDAQNFHHCLKAIGAYGENK